MVNLDVQLSGHYQIVQHLTSTENSDIYLGRSKDVLNDNRRVAIKVLAVGQCDNKNKMRFNAESEVLSNIHHDYIVPVIENGTCDDGRLYMVMPFCSGNLTWHMGFDETDKDIIKNLEIHERPKRMDYSHVKHVVCDVLKALDYLHVNGMVHRDVKPSNIFLTDRAGGPVKLADFGLLKKPDDDRFQDKIWMGSPDYAAPEQRVDSRLVDARADIYAIGAVAYRALTGRLPGKMSPPLRNAGLSVPKDFCHLIMDCMNANPGARPQTAMEVLDRLHDMDEYQIITRKKRPAMLAGKLLRV